MSRATHGPTNLQADLIIKTGFKSLLSFAVDQYLYFWSGVPDPCPLDLLVASQGVPGRRQGRLVRERARLVDQPQ